MPGRRLLGVIATLLVVAFGLVDGGSVAAHTGFESSSPAQGDVVGAPVDVVTLVFTGEPTAIDDGFAAFDGDGAVRSPTAVVVPTPGTFEIAFDPPLADGEVGIRWGVQAADGHVLEGAFSFTVDSPPNTEPPPDTAPPSTTVVTVETDVVSTTVAPPADSAGSDPAADASERSDSDTPSSQLAEAVAPDSEPADAADDEIDLDAFLAEAEDGGVDGSGRALLGRLLSIPSTAIVVGGLAVLAWVYVGSRGGVAFGVRSVRIAAALLAVGAVLEFSGSIAASGEQWSTAFTTGTERSMALRFVGTIVVVAGLRLAVGTEPRARSLSAATTTATAAGGARELVSERRMWWNARPSAPIVFGVAMIVVSYWFDGHTVSRGWAPLHAAVNSVHLVAGSVWFAGVVMLALVARQRRGGSVPVAELVMRFSPLATVASLAVVVAGVAMAVMVLDSPSQIWSTPWGRTLIAKTAVVSVAASLGAYNHFVLRPAFDESPDDDRVIARLRATVTVEALVLCVALMVTVWLVAART